MNQAPAAAAPVIIIQEPLETDVILGRGSAHAWRPANVAFHRLLDQYAPRYYAETSTKKLKTSMIQEIYQQMAARGRFLTKAEATADDDGNASEGFVSLRESDAKARISDAMRYRQRRRKNAAKSAPAALAETAVVAPAAAAARQQPSVPEEEEEQKRPAINEQQQQHPAEQRLMPPPPPVIQNPVVGQQEDISEDEVEIISDTDLSSVLD